MQESISPSLSLGTPGSVKGGGAWRADEKQMGPTADNPWAHWQGRVIRITTTGFA
jgi:hypothetical protein